MATRKALYNIRSYTCLSSEQHAYLKRVSAAHSTTASIYLRRLIEREMSDDLPSPERSITDAIRSALNTVLEELRVTQEMVQSIRQEAAPSAHAETVAAVELDKYKERRRQRLQGSSSRKG
jgi:hypothetical protein